jgi:hypothetical protein
VIRPEMKRRRRRRCRPKRTRRTSRTTSSTTHQLTTKSRSGLFLLLISIVEVASCDHW